MLYHTSYKLQALKHASPAHAVTALSLGSCWGGVPAGAGHKPCFVMHVVTDISMLCLTALKHASPAHVVTAVSLERGWGGVPAGAVHIPF
jgi:hypothetical protein